MQELAKNPRLDQFFVRNFNEDPSDWAVADDSFDAVTCCVRWVSKKRFLVPIRAIQVGQSGTI